MPFIRQAEQKDYLDIAIIHFTSWKAAHINILPESYINAENILSTRM